MDALRHNKIEDNSSYGDEDDIETKKLIEVDIERRIRHFYSEKNRNLQGLASPTEVALKRESSNGDMWNALSEVSESITLEDVQCGPKFRTFYSFGTLYVATPIHAKNSTPSFLSILKVVINNPYYLNGEGYTSLTDIVFYIRGLIDLNCQGLVKTYDVCLNESSKGSVLEILLDLCHQDLLSTYLNSPDLRENYKLTLPVIKKSTKLLLQVLLKAHRAGIAHEGFYISIISLTHFTLLTFVIFRYKRR